MLSVSLMVEANSEPNLENGKKENIVKKSGLMFLHKTLWQKSTRLERLFTFLFGGSCPRKINLSFSENLFCGWLKKHSLRQDNHNFPPKYLWDPDSIVLDTFWPETTQPEDYALWRISIVFKRIARFFFSRKTTRYLVVLNRRTRAWKKFLDHLGNCSWCFFT